MFSVSVNAWINQRVDTGGNRNKSWLGLIENIAKYILLWKAHPASTHLRPSVSIQDTAVGLYISGCHEWVCLNLERNSCTWGWHDNNNFITFHSYKCPQGQITLPGGARGKKNNNPQSLSDPHISLFSLTVNFVWILPLSSRYRAHSRLKMAA